MAKDILGRPLLTVAELEAMTEQERDEALQGNVIYDLDLLPPSYVAKHRAHLEEIIARRDAEQREADKREAS